MAYTAASQNTAAYLTSLSFIQPQYSKLVAQLFPEQFKETIFCAWGVGFEKLRPMDKFAFNGVAGLEAKWFEQTRILEIDFESATTAAPAPGASVTITLANAGTYGGYMDSGTKSFPQVGEIWQHAILGWQGYISAVNKTVANAHTFTFAPVDTAVPLTINSGENLFRVGNTYDEGTGQPQGHVSDYVERTVPFQIIKATSSATGSAMVLKNWSEMNCTPEMASLLGIPANTMIQTNVELNNEGFRHLGMCDRTLLIGNPTNNTNIPDTMQGMDYQLRNAPFPATIMTYTPGALTVSDIDTWNAELNVNGAPSLMAGFVGDLFSRDFNNCIKADLPNGSILYGDFAGKAELAINVGFTSYTKGGRTFMPMVYKGFYNPTTFGVPGTNYRYMGYWVPETTTPVRAANGVVGDAPSFSILYPQSADGKYKRQIQMWQTGAANLNVNNFNTAVDMGVFATSDIDERNFNILSHLAMQVVGANKFGISEPV